MNAQNTSGDRLLFKQAVDQFVEWKSVSTQESTIKGYAGDLKIFCMMFKNRAVEDIQLDDVMVVLTDMMEAGWSKASMMRKCMALRKLFEFLTFAGRDVLSKELIPIPQPERKLPRVVTEEQYKKLLAVLSEKPNDPRWIRNRAVLMMLWDTGIRVGELCSLNHGDVHLGLFESVVRTEKNRGSRPFRPIFWTKETNDALALWIKRRSRFVQPTQPALFISIGNQKHGQRLTNKGVGEMLRQLSIRASLPTINAHSFRHRVGHHIIKQGGSNSDVAAILGHTSLLSTLHYTQLSDQETRQRYRKFQTEN